MKRTLPLFLLTLLLSLLLGAGQVMAAGFQLFNEASARSSALGMAMVSFDDAVESAWINPAATAMHQGAGVMAGSAFVAPNTEYEGRGGDKDMKDAVYPLPYLYGVLPVGHGLALSLAVNVPYGLTTDWDQDWVGRYYATRTDLRCLFLTPSVSYRVLPWLSVGVGAQLSRADAELKRSVSPLVPGLTTRIDGDDDASGYILSLFARPLAHWRVGAVYRSEVAFDLSGHAHYNMAVPGFSPTKVRLPLRLPATLQVGISTTALERWTFSFDYLYTWWSTYEALRFHYDSLPGVGLPGIVSVEKDWDDCYALRFGAEYRLSGAWTLRGSYVLDKSPIDDDTRDPSLPTNDRHLFSVGFGYHWRALQVDGAYTYLKMEDSKTSPATPGLKGHYEGDAHIVNLAVSWSF